MLTNKRQFIREYSFFVSESDAWYEIRVLSPFDFIRRELRRTYSVYLDFCINSALIWETIYLLFFGIFE